MARCVRSAREYFIRRYGEWLIQVYVKNCWRKPVVSPTADQAFGHVIQSRSGRGCLKCLADFEQLEPNWAQVMMRQEEIQNEKSVRRQAKDQAPDQEEKAS